MTEMKVDPAEQYLKSSFYEQLVEHVFISEVLQESWFSFGETVEVLRSEVDASGYDLVLDCAGVVRHVQLKTSRSAARTAQQKVNVALAEKPSGCVIWLVRHLDDETRRLRLTYRFFGGDASAPLPSLEGFRVATHTKANAQGVKKKRPQIRVIPKGSFDPINTTRELVVTLFGLTLQVQSATFTAAEVD